MPKKARRGPKERGPARPAHEHGTPVFSPLYPREFVYKVDSGARAVLETLERAKRARPEPLYVPPSRAEIEKLATAVVRKLPGYMKAAGIRFDITAAEQAEIHREISGFVYDWFRAPVVDGPLIQRMTEVAQLRNQLLGNRFFLTQAGRVLYATPAFPQVVLGCELCRADHENEEAAKAFGFALDVMIEIFGFVFGIVGLSVPHPNEDGVKGMANILRAMWNQPWFKTAWKELIEAFTSGGGLDKGKAILKFMEALEGAGNLGELLTHFMAGLSKWDIAITLAKILLWIAAAVASAGYALAAKIASAVLDLVGLVAKFVHITEEGHSATQPAH